MEEMKQLGSTDRSKDKVKRYIEAEITSLFAGILDYAEVAADSKDRYVAFRSKVLKLGNDTIRKIKKEIDDHYAVTYVPPSEDIIIVHKK